jgi:hypothetical protein
MVVPFLCYNLNGLLPKNPLHLSLYQFDITALGLDQFIVTTLFSDSPVFDDVDDIGLTDGAEPMSDGDRRSPLRGIGESFVDLKF